MVKTTVYDIVSGKVISFDCREAREKFGINNKTYSSLRSKIGTNIVCASRFCYPEWADSLVRNVVELSTGLEFQVLRPESLYCFFKEKFSVKEKIRFSHLMHGNCVLSSIKGYVFCLKENIGKLSIMNMRSIKNSHVFDKELESHFINKRLKRKLTSRYKKAIDAAFAKKCTKTLEIIGCTIDFFASYLENQFKEGMTWGNYGKWEIDHIIPCCLFDLTKENHQRVCFHYSNTRPLWKSENSSRPDDGSDLPIDKLKIAKELGLIPN